ncbi:hypothetical protein STEG23_023313 [Scotinomys teguina]
MTPESVLETGRDSSGETGEDSVRCSAMMVKYKDTVFEEEVHTELEVFTILDNGGNLLQFLSHADSTRLSGFVYHKH